MSFDLIGVIDTVGKLRVLGFQRSAIHYERVKFVKVTTVFVSHASSPLSSIRTLTGRFSSTFYLRAIFFKLNEKLRHAHQWKRNLILYLFVLLKRFISLNLKQMPIFNNLKISDRR